MNSLQTVYINLDRRTDRRALIEAELDALGIPDAHRHRFPAIAHPEGWKGCTRSHYEVLSMAKKAGWPYVWILEDDWMATAPVLEIKAADTENGLNGLTSK